MDLFTTISKNLYGDKLPEPEKEKDETSSWSYICPNCHSDDLELSNDWNGGTETASIEIVTKCHTCGHRFFQVYKFSHLED